MTTNEITVIAILLGGITACFITFYLKSYISHEL